MDCFRRVGPKRPPVDAQIDHPGGDPCHSVEQEPDALVQLEWHGTLFEKDVDDKDGMDANSGLVPRDDGLLKK